MSHIFEFSKRELDVIRLLMQGKSNKEIALALHITEGTVEFHLTRIYARLGVASRTEALVHLGQLGFSQEDFEQEIIGENTETKTGKHGETPVENGGGSAYDGGGKKAVAMTGKRKPFSRNAVILSLLALIILLAAVAAGLYLSMPKTWPGYERECEHPDEYVVGRMIGRDNASGAAVHGQFGTIETEPWTELAGYVVYKNISTPAVEQLYLKLRYSKHSPSSVPILVYIDDEKTPRASIYPKDQQDWNRFTWTEPVFLGTLASGVHTLTFSTVGQQYGVADLDKFVLTAGMP